MNDSFLPALDRELSAAGVRGRQHERILAEYGDHLACDPNAQLGSPVELARQFADAGGMQPDQPAMRSRQAGLAAPLRESRLRPRWSAFGSECWK